MSVEQLEARQEVGRHEVLRRSDSSSKGRELSAPPSFVPRRPQRFSKTVVSHSLVDPIASQDAKGCERFHVSRSPVAVDSSP